MRRIAVLLAAVLLAAGGYVFLTRDGPIRAVALQLQSRIMPCRTPIRYAIGATDARFRIATDTLLADLREAEEVWEKPHGGELFAYDPAGTAASGSVIVSLIYDERQAAADTLARYGIQAEHNKASYDELAATYDAIESSLKRERTALEADAVAHERREEAYNEEVQKWNTAGGAPSGEYARLQKERAALERETAALESRQADINTTIRQLNALAVSLNALIEQLNLSVQKYNETGASIGSDFEEGEYVSAAGSREIRVYEYSNKTELVRVLAHEMGHALGMGHVGGGESIMYRINQGTALVASGEDLAELRRVCAGPL